MRGVALVLFGLLASCTTAPHTDMYAAQHQEELQKLLAGKTAGKPVSCLQNYNATDMKIIDDRNVAFRQGSSGVYLMHLSEGCHLLGSGNYALVTHQFGSLGMCQGDIARVLDTSSRMIVGSCGIDQIVPYRTASAAGY